MNQSVLELKRRLSPGLGLQEILDAINLHLDITANNTSIINTCKLSFSDNDSDIKIVNVDLPVVSWYKLKHIVEHYPSTEVLIIQSSLLTGSSAGLLSFMDCLADTDNKIKIIATLMNEEYLVDKVTSSVFLQNWDNALDNDTLYIYYQPHYNAEVKELLHETTYKHLRII